ncbi:hypothetical protein DCAR_0625840 [Daucus carota subsp. sativus]|uniref:Late embryogenesis abundant protein LEA-2 subgroup domain-containing protein n=2 Tax=Daucus carota subsp. sativus TaxID=79200 RepID=A0AAF1B6G4_DAUCS|nr:PREDICTED: protein NDR1-like [Daucus carota subsp. sativus]WOH06413.1 hypothetical protein DCAR_0625840 [Daucus carota subsp. sativus]
MGLSGKGCLVFSCCSLTLILFIPIFITLNLAAANGSQVRASIEALFVPAIMSNVGGYNSLINSTSIFFIFLLRDTTYQMGVYYDNITLTFSYVNPNTSVVVPVANYTTPGFYQKGNDHGSRIDRSDYVETHGVSWKEASENVSQVVLRVDLATAVRFKYASWKSKRHHLLLHGDVKISTRSANKVGDKGTRLRSSSGHSSGYKGFIVFSICFYVVVCIVWFFSIFFTCKDDY